MSINNQIKVLAECVDRDAIPDHILEGADRALGLVSRSFSLPLPTTFMVSPDYAKLCSSIVLGAPRKVILAKSNQKWLASIRYKPYKTEVESTIDEAILSCKNAFEVMVLIISNIVRDAVTLKGSAYVNAEALVRSLTNDALRAEEKKVVIGEKSLGFLEDAFHEISWCSCIKPIILKMIS